LKGLNLISKKLKTGDVLTSEGEKDKSTSHKGESEEDRAERARVVVSVTRISCATCARAIEKQVGKMEGIKDVKTAVMLNKVFIDYDPKLIDSGTIRKAIDKTGYKSYMTIEQNR
jgi:Cu+-exporting ATPase